MTPIGAILTGGRSRRMGRQKALVEVDGVPMARRVADAALGGGCSSVVLIGGDPDELAPLGIDVVDDLHPGEGPVGALLTACAAVPRGTPVVMVACDMPYLDAATVRLLIDTAHRTPVADAVVAHSGRLEPGCALWRESALAEVTEQFAAGERALHRVLRRLRTVEVRVEPSVVVNINEPNELPEDREESH